MSKPFAEFLEWANQVNVAEPKRNPFNNLFRSNGKRCQICNTLLRNPKSTFCSKGCICFFMTCLSSSPEYYAKRAEQRQKRLVETFCKICHRSLGLRKPSSRVRYCSRECVGADPDICRSKAEKRKALWQNPTYRQLMSDYAIARNADPSNGFGKNHHRQGESERG